MNILLATKNVNKHKEISKIFKDSGNFHKAIYKENLIEVVEDKNTILENAQKKAFEIYNHYQIPVISDDSGLFVNSLNGMPGLRSKRYAGENATDIENIEILGPVDSPLLKIVGLTSKQFFNFMMAKLK